MTSGRQSETLRTFTRVICGVNGSPEAAEAVRQATMIAAPAAAVLLVAAIDPSHELWDAPRFEKLAVAARVQERAEELLARTQAAVESTGEIETQVVEGPPSDVLLSLIAPDSTCLLALGAAERQDRLAGILLGSVVTRMLHSAPCSILVARTPSEPQRFPRSVVVGVDGSPESAAAYAAAAQVAARLDAELHPLVALGGKGADLESVQRIVSDRLFEVDKRSPADALSAADADLLVVGSRGLHGLDAVGSVSERIAHQSRCSVLVVRPASPPAD